MVSAETSEIVTFTNSVIMLWVVISVFGTVTNVINLAIFSKLRFKETINISLTGLAVSDLLSLVVLIWCGICLNPSFQELDLPFVPRDVQYLTGAWPHNYFSRVTSWITAFVTLERCLCIARPLTVRRIITPNRNILIIVGIFITVAATISPAYFTYHLTWTFFSGTNRTLLSLSLIDNADEVNTISYSINSVFSSIFSFVIVAICTGILSYKLSNKSARRQKLAASTRKAGNTLELRDVRLVKRVAILSSIFIVTYTPLTAFFIAVIFEPELNVRGAYKNISGIVYLCSTVLEALNSSLSIFVYVTMSTKFRLAFYQVFGKRVQNYPYA